MSVPEGPPSIGAPGDEDDLQSTLVLDQIRSISRVGYHNARRVHGRHPDSVRHGSQPALIEELASEPRIVAFLTAS